MIERGKCLGFPFEARQPLGIVREGVGQDLDCDLTAKLGVESAVDFAMPPAPMADWISYGPRREPEASGIRSIDWMRGL